MHLPIPPEKLPLVPLLAAVALTSCYSPDWTLASDTGGAASSATAGSTTTGAESLASSGGASTGVVMTASGGESADGSASADSDSGSSDSTTGPEPVDEIPGVVKLDLAFAQIKEFRFTWNEVEGADYYQLYEKADIGEPYSQILGDLDAANVTATVVQPLHFRPNASYILRACNTAGCSESDEVAVMSTMAAAVGYFKASNTDGADDFGARLALSADGRTLAVSARGEASVNGDQADDSAPGTGAVYVFRLVDGVWSQEAYIKASNAGAKDWFGSELALSADGDTIAVGAKFEDSSETGVDGQGLDDSATDSGAVYVFTRDGGTWSQRAYLKASNAEASDNFGYALSLSGDGQTLAVGAHFEDSKVGGDEADNSMSLAGAVYVFARTGEVWAQQAYVKASNTTAGDAFGFSVSLSHDGDTMAVGASLEDYSGEGINGQGSDNEKVDSGAAYVFTRTEGVWSQQAYVKASNTGAGDHFGYSVALSGDGDTLAVSAEAEDSGFVGNELNNSVKDAGAVYVFRRSGSDWAQQAYLKASRPDQSDYFGEHVDLNDSGDILAVGANRQDSGAKGINDIEDDYSGAGAGAAYVFKRIGETWVQKAFVKASNTGTGDEFGVRLELSGDGLTLAVGAPGEQSNSEGIGKNQSNNSLMKAGAVYLF